MNPNQSVPENSALGESAAGAHQPPVDPQDQLLVAYLDGELSEMETADLEARLAEDTVLRGRLHDLQATWDLLDELPRTETDRSFLKSTIEMVVMSANRKKAKWHRWPLRISALLAAFLLTCWLAFQYARSLQTQPYQQFVRDLSFLENVDMYDQIQDVAFLEALRDQGVFSDSVAETDVSYLQLPNQQRLESMDDSALTRLKQSQRAFRQSPPENQKLLRNIHDEIFQRPDRDQLVATLQAYSQWLQTLSTAKYQFADLPISDRVQRVIQMRNQQVLDYFGRVGETSLPSGDVEEFLQWLKQFIESNKQRTVERINDHLSRNSSRSNRRRPDFTEIRADRVFALLWGMDEKSALDLIQPADVSNLQQSLSERTAATLTPLSLQDQKKLVGVWLNTAIESMRNVPEEKLWAFYKDMPAEDKEQWEGLPPREMRDAIRSMYHAKNRPDEDEVWHLFWERPGTRGGPGRRSGQRRPVNPRD